jgi:1-phosphofructokinase family hexose kinase
MLITNPNPCFDRTTTMPTMIPGAVLRALAVEVSAGGKGINVARVIRTLGGSAPIFLLSRTGGLPEYTKLLESEGAEFEYLEIAGNTRTASIYLESTNDRITIVNEPGEPITTHDWHSYVREISVRCSPGQIVVCMGSLPPGYPDGAMQELVRAVQTKGAMILVDTAPDALLAAAKAGADILTPNLEEAEAALSGKSGVLFTDDRRNARARSDEAARQLVTLGAKIVCVTAGSEGVAFASSKESWWADAYPISFVSAVGAGDSFAAGLVLSWQAQSEANESMDWHRAVNLGIACGASSCEKVLAGGVDPLRVKQIVSALRTHRQEI